MTKETTMKSRFAAVRAVMRWVLAAIFVAAGIAHLAVPDVLLKITPDGVPFPRQVILVTGLCELAGAAALVL
ncbi:MAG: DoxX family protein, partial [Xanthobacteraceae bacterium]